MRKITIVFITVGFLLISTVVWASYDSWSTFQKKEGIIQSQNGVLTLIPGDAEKNEVVKSIDPITGLAMKKLDSAVPINSEKFEVVNISHVFDGYEDELTFDVVYHDEEPVLLTNNDRPYVVTSIPNSRESLIQYRENLFIVDMYNKSIRNALSDQVDGYNRDDVSKKFADKQGETQGLTWGGNASFNLDGSKMIYFSNRNTVLNDESSGEMWLKDWKTGEEKTLREWRSSIIGWGPEDEVFLQSIGDSNTFIESFNINTGQTSQVIEQFMTMGFSYPYLIFQQDPKLLYIYQIDTKETKLIKSDLPYMVRSFVTNKNSPWALVINAPERTSLDSNILVINMETGNIKQLESLANTIIEYAQWIDDSQFLLNIRTKGTSVVETYIVNLDKFWGGEKND